MSGKRLLLASTAASNKLNYFTNGWGRMLSPSSSSGMLVVHRNFGGRSERVAFAMSKLANSLHREGIEYCVVGGNALHAHGYERATTDVDVLMTKDGLKTFVETHVGRGYTQRFEGAKTKFRNTADDVPIDILLTGSYPGETQTEVPFPHPRDISYDESFFSLGGDSNNTPQTIRVVDLKNLINLKLVSYKDLPEERIQDYVDVRKLIEINLLQEDFEKNLHPSVHDLYRKAVATVKKIKQRDMNDTIG